MKPLYLITVVGTAGIVTSQQPVAAQTFLTYHCRNGLEFVVAFFEGDRFAHLQIDGKAVALPRRLSISGSRYSKGDITLRITKTVTTLKRDRSNVPPRDWSKVLARAAEVIE